MKCYSKRMYSHADEAPQIANPTRLLIPSFHYGGVAPSQAIWGANNTFVDVASYRVFRVLEFSSVSPIHGGNRKRLRLPTSLCSVGLQALREDTVPTGLHFLVEHLRGKAISQPEARNGAEGALSFF